MREDWIECNLDEVCEVLDNLRKPINSNERNERIKGKVKSELFPYYGATGQVGYIDDYLTDGDFVLLGEDAAPFLDFTKDVAYKITGKTWVNNHAHILKSHFNDDFLLHYLNQFQYRDFVTGTTRLKLTQGALKRMPFKLAPLPIQRAIVSKIEALFSDLDNGIANFKKAQEQLKVYRQAVLKKAFEGELTKEWRAKQTNLPTAEELLKQIKEERQNHYNQQIEDWKKAVKEWEKNGKKGKKPSKPTESKELPPLKDDELKDLPELHDNGVYVRMGNLSDVVRGGSPRPAGNERYYNGNIPFLKVADLTRSTTKYVNTYTYTIKEAGLHKTRLLEPGTLVISNSGATLGVPRILSIKATANDGIAAFLGLNESRIEYLYHYWDSKTLALRAIDQGAGQPNLNTDLLKNYPVPVFSLQEQTQIVQEIESRLSVCDKMEQSINESIEKAEALRQSILKKAFEGKLLSEAEIAQCKQAADYEPASELLKKIQAEKLAKEQEKKKKPTIKKKSKK